MKLIKPRMKAVRFDQEDVITTSGARPLLHLSGWGDYEFDNNTFSYEAQDGRKSWILGENYGNPDGLVASNIQFLQKYVGRELSNTITDQTEFVVPDTLSRSVVNLVNVDDEDFSVFNGNYQYDTSQNKFIMTN